MSKDVNSNFNTALEEWTLALGEECVITNETVRNEYALTTLSQKKRKIPAIIFAKSKEDVASIVRISNKYLVPIYPISTGKNWGFGSKSPIEDNCVVVDLSKMNRIISLDPILGVVTVEPGVTFNQLDEYLRSNKTPFVVPITGAGGSTSVLGNLLERGRSDNGYIDRASTLLGLQAILANGDFYESFPESITNTMFHKWKAGPSLDGLFFQSNFAIILNVTIILARKPDYVVAFAAPVIVPLEKVIDSFREIAFEINGSQVVLNLLHKSRAVTATSNTLSPEARRSLSQRKFNNLDEQNESLWTIQGHLSGREGGVKEARSFLSKKLKFLSDSLIFLDKNEISVFKKITSFLPSILNFDKRFRFLRLLTSIINSAYGYPRPNSTGPIWRKSMNMSKFELMRIAKEGYNFDADPHCGFIIFNGVMPMKGSCVKKFIDKAEQLFFEYEADPMMGLFFMSAICLKVSIRLHFDKSLTSDVERASQCYLRLEDAIMGAGGFVDRKNINSSSLLNSKNTKSEDLFLAKKIKKILDPNSLMSPGRYLI